MLLLMAELKRPFKVPKEFSIYISSCSQGGKIPPWLTRLFQGILNKRVNVEFRGNRGFPY